MEDATEENKEGRTQQGPGGLVLGNGAGDVANEDGNHQNYTITKLERRRFGI